MAPDQAYRLTPQQLTVLEVFRRLEAARLPSPTQGTLSQLSKIRPSAVHVACEQLVDLGYLQRTTKRGFGGFVLTESSDTPEAHAA